MNQQFWNENTPQQPQQPQYAFPQQPQQPQYAFPQQPQYTNTTPPKKQKFSKKSLLILGAVAILVIAAFVAVLFIPSHFEKVSDEALQIAGQLSGVTDTKFTIDTYPYEDTNMSSSTIAILAPSARTQALEAIKYVNEALGFSSSLYNDMLKTSYIMGRQSEENDDYRVSWTYHPNEGLEVTYEKK